MQTLRVRTLFICLCGIQSEFATAQCIVIEHLPCELQSASFCVENYGPDSCQWNGTTFICQTAKEHKSANWDYDGIRDAEVGENGFTGYTTNGVVYCQLERNCESECAPIIIGGQLVNACQSTTGTWTGYGMMFSSLSGSDSCTP